MEDTEHMGFLGDLPASDVLDRMQSIIADVQYKDGWTFHTYLDGQRVVLQIRTPDWHGAKHFLSRHMTRQEVVGKCKAAVDQAERFEIDSTFHYKGQPIFHHHIDPDVMVEACRKGRFLHRSGEPSGL